MRRAHKGRSLGDRVWRIGSILMLAGAGAMFLTQLSALRRYVRMRRISGGGHPAPPGTLPEASDAPPRWGTSHWPLH